MQCIQQLFSFPNHHASISSLFFPWSFGAKQLCEMFKPRCVVDEKTASKTKCHHCCWTRVLLCLFRTLVMPTNTPSACIISRLWVIVSVYVFEGGWCKGEWRFPPSYQVALPCFADRPTEPGFDSGGGSFVRDQNVHPPAPSLSHSQEHLCGWVDRSCACTHAGNCKHICINTHSSFLLCHQADSNIHIGAPCSRRRCCRLLISYLRLCRQGSFFLNKS